MNWNKAKTILIIAFIILNIFLIYAVNENNKQNYEGLDDRFIKKVEENLAEKNIIIEAEIAKEIYKMPLLEVKYRIFQEKDVLYFLGDKYEERIEEEYFVKDNGSYIKIENNKKLTYNIRGINEAFNISEEEGLKFVEDFIKIKKINLENYELDSKITEENIHIFTYKRIYENKILENDYYRFIVDSDGVAGIEVQNIETVEPKEGLIYVTSAYESLLRLKNESDNKKIIKEVEICYYTNENTLEWENIVRANMDPTWKVVFKDGDIKYLIETE